MSSKINVLLLAIHYPFAIKNYFEAALKKRDDVSLITVGPYSGCFIPWKGGMRLPQKYAVPPNIPLPFDLSPISYEVVRTLLPSGWKPDICLNIDAGVHWREKPRDGIAVHVATDPHALDYSFQRSVSDVFFCMQKSYMQNGDIYLPYAYSPEYHFPPSEDIEKRLDAVLIGMEYPQRIRWVRELQRLGVIALLENGPIFHDARDIYHRSRIGLNWSSLDDLNARVFEIPAMGLPLVTNFVSDLPLFLNEGRDCLVFRTLDEAVDAVIYLLEHEAERKEMAERGRERVLPHTYDARVEQILKECHLV